MREGKMIWFLGLMVVLMAPWCARAFEEKAATFPASLEKEFPEGASTQCLLVVVEEASGSAATVFAFEKIGGDWKPALMNIPAVIGRNGLAEPGLKREGDGRSPSGVFLLGRVFGYGPVLDGKMPYSQVTEDDIWVDDPESPAYNTWISRKTSTAKSFEDLKRKDDLYKWGMVIEYNTGPIVKGHGSAIFFHLWSGPGSSTSGCVAVAEADMIGLLRWLDPGKKPCIALKTRASLL